MVDELDMKIIKLLEEDASLPYTEIARRLKLNEATVRRRVEALKRKEVIRKFTIIVDPLKIGFNTTAVLGVDADPSKILEVARKLCEIPEVRYLTISTGDHMLVAEVWSVDDKELSEIISEKIGKIEGVLKVSPAIILKRLKP